MLMTIPVPATAFHGAALKPPYLEASVAVPNLRER